MRDSNIIITNGKIYTMDSINSIHTLVVIKNSKIIYTGNDEITKFIDQDTQIIDAKGNIVLPGFIDSHIHPPGTALTELYEVSLYGLNSVEEYKNEIKEFIDKNPDVDIIYGKGWSLGNFTGEEISKGPKKEHLDEISTTIPIVLRAYDGHTLWLNSKAFLHFNININTNCPIGGKIGIDENTNTLWGTLKESATHLIEDVKYTDKQIMKAFELFQRKMHRYGITSILSISGLHWGMSPQVFTKLEEEDKLKLRISNGIMIFSEEDENQQIDKVIELTNKYKSKYFKNTTLKLLGDGVVEGTTANLLKPYEEEAGKGENYFGEFLWEEEKLGKIIERANNNHLSIHVHSVGDGATNKMLDAFENFDKKDSKLQRSSRNALTHLQLVEKSDIERFKRLNIIASIQPYWHIKGPGWWEIVDYKFLGKRAEEEYPLNSFVKEGVLIASSSDHSVTPTPNPFYGIQAGVTRNLYNAKYFNSNSIEDIDDERYLLNKNERTSVMEMVKSFTINNAYTIFREEEIGSIEVEKSADIIIIDKDIFEINPLEIENTEVLLTIFDGEVVYKSENFR